MQKKLPWKRREEILLVAAPSMGHIWTLCGDLCSEGCHRGHCLHMHIRLGMHCLHQNLRVYALQIDAEGNRRAALFLCEGTVGMTRLAVRGPWSVGSGLD